jgi:PIN domain nuclease of toxin-antitoxin system
VSGRYLVDTNIVLWAWHEPHRVPCRLLDLLATDAEFHVSIATIWEICIKVAIGKLDTVDNVPDALISTGYRILPIKIEHAEGVRHLPPHPKHGDPFDRLLIVQAQLENLTMITSDQRFGAYDLAMA